MYRYLMAAHVLADMAFVAGLMATWLLHAFKARDLAAWSFEVVANTAIWAVLATGITLISMNPAVLREPWMWLKLALLAGLFGMHGLCARLGREEAPPARHERMALLTALLVAGVVVAVIARPLGSWHP